MCGNPFPTRARVTINITDIGIGWPATRDPSAGCAGRQCLTACAAIPFLRAHVLQLTSPILASDGRPPETPAQAAPVGYQTGPIRGSCPRQDTDEQLSATEIANAFAQPSLTVGTGEAVDDAAGTDGFNAERHGQVAFAGTGLADEVDHLAAIDEVELGKRQDTVAVERGLEGEVESRTAS